MTPISRSKQVQHGFTLLELMLVMGIIALAAALVVPNLSGTESRDFAAQLRELTAQLNYSRRSAVVSGQVSMIRLSNRDDEMTAQENPVINRWHSESIRFAFSGDGGNSGESFSHGESFSRAERVGSDDYRGRDFESVSSLAIHFYPEGGSSGGVLQLSQDQQVAWIAIDSFTGRITLSRDDES